MEARQNLAWVVFLLIPGCASPPFVMEEARGSEDVAPALAPSPPTISLGGQALWRASATGCSGSFLGIPISVLAANELVGDRYTPIETVTGVVMVVMESVECPGTSATGPDAGTASLVLIEIAIRHPEGAEPPEGYLSSFLVELGSNNRALYDFLAHVAGDVRKFDVTHELLSTPSPFDRWSGQVRDNRSPIYS